MAQVQGISLSRDDRAALERLARRNDNVGLHARIVLGAARGDSVAAISRRECASRETVRKWLARHAESGVAGVYPCERRRGFGKPAQSASKLHPVPVPPALLAGPGAGPSAQLCIECAVRDAIGRGRLSPGTELPGRAWFGREFGVTAPVVNRAFRNLAAGGFVEARPRSATRVAARLPFAGRFLLVLEEANADGTSGICENLEKAARETESRRRGVAWDVVWRTPENTPALARDLAAHRWCGAFLRFAHTTSPNWTPGEAALASVPGVPMGVETVYKGTAVSPLVRELHLSDHEPWGEVFAKCVAAGMRRALVLDTPAGRGARDREGEVRAAAAASGVSIPEFGYAVPLSTDTGESIRRLLAMQSRLVRPGDVDAILVRRDDLLHHLAPVLRANWGERAASAVRVVCWSVGTLLADEGLRVEWRGYDIVSTMLSFIDWAEDVRSGARHPAEPRVARA